MSLGSACPRGGGLLYLANQTSSAAMNRVNFSVANESGIVRSNGRMVAIGRGARLGLSLHGDLGRLRWIRLRYLTSFFDDPVRPLIGFLDRNGEELLQPMNGPVLGRGEWIGRVPDGTVSLAIYPVKEPGVFHFEIEDIRTLSRFELLRQGISLDPLAIVSVVGAKIIGAKEEGWETLKFGATPTPLQDYSRWFKKLHRNLRLSDIDRPRSDWSSGPIFHFLMPLEGAPPDALLGTLRSLRNQAYQNWTLRTWATANTPSELLAAWKAETTNDTRFVFRTALSPLADLHENGRATYVGLLGAGDTLPQYATAVLAETVARYRAPAILYSDEDSVSSEGVPHSPIFKPDFSPVFLSKFDYLGRLTCISVERLLSAGIRSLSEFTAGTKAVSRALASLSSADDVRHIRRVLYHRASAHEGMPAPAQRTIARAPRLPEIADTPSVSIVIPTRDRADLLGKCLRSLKELTDYPNYHVVVVDNGSAEREALDLLRDLEGQAGFKVVRHPGKFNFSTLSNVGAKACMSDVLVFLNNDTVVFDGDWLRALVDWVVRPGVGVVGAKLLFPDRSLEHAGVVLGHSGIAGHLYHGHDEHEPGYIERLTVPHEVMAVTGACMAVRRDVFDSVEGFDEANLPVDLNDIDFCLKVHELGLSNIWTPHCVLYHLQSASRGRHLKPFERYRKERDYFRKRWSHIIRDDPCFHPGLSLYSHRPALA